MSGIVGMVNLDGAPVDRGEIVNTQGLVEPAVEHERLLLGDGRGHIIVPVTGG